MTVIAQKSVLRFSGLAHEPAYPFIVKRLCCEAFILRSRLWYWDTMAEGNTAFAARAFSIRVKSTSLRSQRKTYQVYPFCAPE